MRRLIVTVILTCTALTGVVRASDEPVQEFRAAWLTTLLNIDWPKTQSMPDSAALIQLKELTDMLDRLQAGNINTVCFQVRPSADALYESTYEPWSPVLTGVRGMHPGYDPLACAIAEAHRRGMELHAWVNPFRYERTAHERVVDIETFIASEDSDPIRIEHPDWLLTYNNNYYKGTILDPGNPDARAYVVQVLMEIIRNYDIDGLVMDDYFYPYGGTTNEDARTHRKYRPANISAGDWRRECVNNFVHTVYDSIRSIKPWVKLGMSPFGIYSITDTAAAVYGLTLPAGITGTDAWADLYCDPLAWVAGGYVDYLAPQLYWSTKATKQSYEVLCRWWNESVAAIDAKRADGRKTHVYISHASYRFDSEELAKQVDINRLYAIHGAPGSMFYNTNQYLKFTGGKKTEDLCEQLRKTRFTTSVPAPVMPWKNQPAPLTADTLTVPATDTLSLPATDTLTTAKPDSVPACCDSVKQNWKGSRFKRMTIRQKTEN